jgi:uncharacterized protein
MILGLSIFALFLAPLVVNSLEANAHSHAHLHQKFYLITLVVVGAIILFHILPESIEHGGWAGLIFFGLGFLLPLGLERLLNIAVKKVHLPTLIISTLGLMLHTLIDGSALVEENLLPLAIILHRLPMGLIVWVMIQPSFGKPTALIVLILMAFGTWLGYHFGGVWLHELEQTVEFNWFQAFISATLLHILLHRSHDHNHGHDH